MTEKKQDTKGKKLGLAQPGKLELNKTVSAGHVRQSFSHGRSKMVTVEVRKKRTFVADHGGRMEEIDQTAPVEQAAAPEAKAEKPKPKPQPKKKSGQNLTDGEKAGRMRALEAARIAAVEAEKIAAEKAEEEALRLKNAPPEPEPEPEPTPEPEVEVAPVVKAVKNQVEKTDQPVDVKTDAQKQAEAIVDQQAQEKETDAKLRVKKPLVKPEIKKTTSKRDRPRRRGGKLTIAEALGGQEERTRSLASVKRARERDKIKAQQLLSTAKKIIRDVVVPETITVQELSNRMAERSTDVIRTLMKMDVMATLDQSIDADTAELVIAEFGHRLKRVAESDIEDGLKSDADDEANMVSRAPVVTIMGHVDHGKTSLLDALRTTDVVAGEAGGITQHIGAYQVTMETGAKICFLDTPGHAAFTEMRSRGAEVTDIVVLCVAADDGIMPQTVEAIRHAKAANVPIIIAINKIDKEGADPTRVRTELLQHDIQVEEMGGEALSVEVSALKKTNLDKLEETILLQAELMDLKANPNRSAEGVIVEARMEQGRGAVSTALVQRGTLNVGEIVVAGRYWGRVRALSDAMKKSLDSAGPSVPVEILGLNGAPNAGDELVVVENEARAREVTEYRDRQEREAKASKTARGTLEEIFALAIEGEAKQLPVIIKADVHGSVEAISTALDNMGTDEAKVNILHGAVGGINESDITLSVASNALILAFNVRANPQAREMAKRDKVDIRYYSIIYNLLDDIKMALTGMLDPRFQENFLGYADIKEVFSVSKVGKIAGCMVTEGQVRKGSKVRLIRDDVVIHEGDLSQLKRFKDDVKEVKEGTECGMAFANYQDIQVGDRIECFEMEEVAREL